MFIYDNGKICIASATRCGHTSMSRYFERNSSTDKSINDWLKSSSRKILVLRHPYDRLQSAIKHADFMKFPKEILAWNSQIEIYNKEQWIDIHSRPYLIHIPYTTPFEIIDFRELSEYIPMHKDTMPTNTSNIHHKNISISSDMRKEFDRYRYFLTHCKKISPEEWKLLTNGDDSGILVE